MLHELLEGWELLGDCWLIWSALTCLYSRMCAILIAGANATCPVVLRNPGNMRVANVSVIGDSNNCSKSLMHPNETFHCFMSKQLVQYDYEQKFFVLSATNISGAAYGPMPLRTDAVLVADLAFPSLTPVYNMTLSLTVNRSEVHRVGDTVLYTMMAVRLSC